jgi:hypothetical protein
MGKNHVIIVRVSKSQKDRIEDNAKAKGFKTISGYVRDLALRYDSPLEKKVCEIHSKLSVVEDYLKRKPNQPFSGIGNLFGNYGFIPPNQNHNYEEERYNGSR